MGCVGDILVDRYISPSFWNESSSVSSFKVQHINSPILTFVKVDSVAILPIDKLINRKVAGRLQGSGQWGPRWQCCLMQGYTGSTGGLGNRTQ